MAHDRAAPRALVRALTRAGSSALVAALLLVPARARAQVPTPPPAAPDSVRPSPDTLRVPPASDSAVRTGAGPRRPRAAPVARLDLTPPISPRRAFLSSLLVPGLGQLKLDRPSAGALFVTVELAAIVMASKSVYDLRAAKQFRADSLVQVFNVDTLTGAPLEGRQPLGPGPFTNDLVGARRVHLEDWLAVMAFNHLIAGAEAFVAANLWDLPGQVGAQRTERGPAIRFSFRW